MNDDRDPVPWTGDDPREFGPEPDEDRCPECGADALTPCESWCRCLHCRVTRPHSHPKDAA